MNLFIAVVVLTLLNASRTPAAILLDEPFDHADGPIAAVANGPWSTHSGVSNQINVAAGAVQLTSAETEDMNAPLQGQPYFPAGAPNVFFARFTVRFTALPSSGGAWFAAFKDGAATGFRARVFALTSGAASGKFRLGLSTANNATASVTNETDLSLNASYAVVVKLVNTNSNATLWLDPARESDPAITTTETASSFTVAAFALRQNSGMGTLTLDDLVVGTSFAEVLSNASAAPVITTEPESQIVSEGEKVSFNAVAVGARPFSFQWFFHAAPIPGATASHLDLANVTFAQQGDYSVTVTNLIGATTSRRAQLTVFARVPLSTNPAFTLLSYNAHGNQIDDWTTNSAQVQAIGRQVQFLNPDIITFQEIPLTNNGTAQMTNFVAAFRPGFHLASNSGTDGFIRSVILSRFPIARSTKWLDGASLANFGYEGTFTRDLFEAEINVPGLPQPLHVFTTHLKSGQDSDSTRRRAAEARAISNAFVTAFLKTNALRPFVLTGDMNEDVASPPAGGMAIPTMTGVGTGFRLTTPLNPITRSHLTFSIRAASLTRRYDYILPSVLLAANVTTSFVFRADLATNIAPARPGDATAASDHLPILMAFVNPYAAPLRVTQFGVTNDTARLTWNCVPGGRYRVEVSRNFMDWIAAASGLIAEGSALTFITNAAATPQFFRVRTEP